MVLQAGGANKYLCETKCYSKQRNKSCERTTKLAWQQPWTRSQAKIMSERPCHKEYTGI